MCSLWLADCSAELGRPAEARAPSEQLLGYAKDVGLYAEEVDPPSGHHPGNFPQAFSHVAQINAAVALAEAEERHEQPSDGAGRTCALEHDLPFGRYGQTVRRRPVPMGRRQPAAPRDWPALGQQQTAR